MSAPVSEIVDRVLDNARKMSTTLSYDWATARAALARVLADLEARDRDDPSLERLRAFIAEGDRETAPRRRPDRPEDRSKD